MKKFVFRFQTLLDTKKHFEEKCENELAALTRNQLEEEKRLSRMNRKLNDCRKEHLSSQTAKMEDIRRYRNYLEKLNKDIFQQKETIKKAAGEAEKKRLELIEIRKEKLALEKLMGNDFQRYQKDMMMWERKFLDEISTSGYIRQRNSDSIY